MEVLLTIQQCQFLEDILEEMADPEGELYSKKYQLLAKQIIDKLKE